jgi:hypothetical protein
MHEEALGTYMIRIAARKNKIRSWRIKQWRRVGKRATEIVFFSHMNKSTDRQHLGGLSRKLQGENECPSHFR